VCSDQCRLVYDLMQQGEGHICDSPDTESPDECAASGGAWKLWDSERSCADQASGFGAEMAGVIQHWDEDCPDPADRDNCHGHAGSGFTQEDFLAFVQRDVLHESGETCCADWTTPPIVPCLESDAPLLQACMSRGECNFAEFSVECQGCLMSDEDEEVCFAPLFEAGLLIDSGGGSDGPPVCVRDQVEACQSAAGRRRA
jgi:hypothetical protein